MRPYLAYICAPGKCDADLFPENRNFDVAYHAYKGEPDARAEYQYKDPRWPFRFVAQELMPVIRKGNYKAVALLNDDVTLNINSLFFIGDNLGLEIWHPALTWNSVVMHAELSHKVGSSIRESKVVDFIAPFFTLEALEKVLDTFDITDSCWGAERVWASRCEMHIVDSYPAIHTRPQTKTYMDDVEIMRARFPEAFE